MAIPNFVGTEPAVVKDLLNDLVDATNDEFAGLYVSPARRFTTVALLLAASGTTAGDGAVADNAPGMVFTWDGTDWLASGVGQFASTSARDAALTVPVDGWRARALDTGILYQRVSGTWKAWESDWITWSTAPTNLAVGTGGSASQVQRYKFIAGRVLFNCKYVLGTSGASVGSSPLINLPFSLRRPVTRYPALVGSGSMYDTSTNASAWLVNPRLDQLTANQLTINTYNGSYQSVTATAPWTWAAGDEIDLEFWGDPA